MSDRPPGITPDLLGTSEHPAARDLSKFLVHITKDEEALGSILANGVIEAREPHGFTKGLFMVRDEHLSACFTEMPLTELSRMSRFGQYGIAFRKDFVQRAGGNRVWYLDGGSAPLDALTAIRDRLIEQRDWHHEFWKVSPFIDYVMPGVYAWEHEREWRVVGGLRFQWSDIALVIAPSDSELGEGQAGTAVYDPTHDEVSWWGNEALEISAAVELLAERFDEIWMSADDAGIPWDEHEGGYQNVGIPIFDGWDAIEDQYSDFPVYVREGIRRVLADRLADALVRRSDVDECALDADNVYGEEMSEDERRRLEEEGFFG